MIELDFSKGDGLITAIAQDWRSGEVLMVAHINKEAWEHTLSSGLATYWSRSRKELWIKGMSSGHTQKVIEILVDCDIDAVVLKVEQLGGAACHKGFRSCFHRKVDGDSLQLIAEPVFDPATVYKKG